MPESKSPWFTPPRLDTGSMPLTEPHPAPIFDTGPHPQPLSLWGGPEESAATEAELDDAARDIADDDSSDLDDRSEPVPVPAQPTVVPGQLIAVKRWKFILLTL